MPWNAAPIGMIRAGGFGPTQWVLDIGRAGIRLVPQPVFDSLTPRSFCTEGGMTPILAHHLEIHHVPVLIGLFASGAWIGWHAAFRWIGWR